MIEEQKNCCGTTCNKSLVETEIAILQCKLEIATAALHQISKVSGQSTHGQRATATGALFDMNRVGKDDDDIDY